MATTKVKGVDAEAKKWYCCIGNVSLSVMTGIKNAPIPVEADTVYLHVDGVNVNNRTPIVSTLALALRKDCLC